MATALATKAQLEERLGRALTTQEAKRAPALLDDASAAVRSITGALTAGSQTVRVRARGGLVRLRRAPTAVAAVADVDGNALEFTWYAGTQITLAAVPLGGYVDVTFTAGAVPKIVVAVVCQMVLRALGVNPDDTAYQQESVGDYSRTVGAAAAAGAIGMLASEEDQLRKLGPVGGMAALG